jgi:uncharacterized protein with HEPN domain
MSQRPAADYLQDILDAIGSIARFVAGMDLEELQQDEKTLFATSRGFEIIGEAVKNIPEDFRSKYPGIPWKSIAGMRDKLIHSYWGIDIQVLWKTIGQDLPQLKIVILKILEQSLEDNKTNNL